MTTKLSHPHVASLRTINSKTNFTEKNGNLSKRKSAVQMLQETKAFYVKSETVLDKKQEFRPGKGKQRKRLQFILALNRILEKLEF